MSAPFRVAVSRELLLRDGTMVLDIGLGLLETAHGVEYEFLRETVAELRPDQLRGFDSLLMEGSRLTAESLVGAGRLSIVARLGVGYDNVDLDACTTNATLVTIAPDGVRRAMAVAAITLVLALSQRLLIKDRLTRAGRWTEAVDYLGVGLEGRTLGVIGLGNIGQEVMRLIEPYGMRRLASDPHVSADAATGVGAELVDLETLLAESDFVIVLCPLTSATERLIDEEKLGLMKSTAYLINLARGPIVHQSALTSALRAGRIQGAGLDVFEREPVAPDDPLLALENVIVTPHGLGSTDQCFRACGESAITSILDVAAGRLPEHIVNRAVLDDPRLDARLSRFREDHARSWP